MKEKCVFVLNIPFLQKTLPETVDLLEKRLIQKEKTFVVTANPEIVMRSVDDPSYRSILHKAHIITADGIGIVKAATWLGTPLPERVTGYDLFIQLLVRSDESSYSIYLLGAEEAVLQKVKEKIKKDFPHCTIAGAHHGFFHPDDRTIEKEIQELQPDIVFVALGVPRQEQWISERLSTFSKGLFIGIGGSFDVFAGKVKRAPKIWQTLHLEWLYRLIQQPSRWKRMLALPRFLFRVLGEKVKVKNE